VSIKEEKEALRVALTVWGTSLRTNLKPARYNAIGADTNQTNPLMPKPSTAA